MKKIIVILMSGVLIATLAACTPTQQKVETAAPNPENLAPTGGASDKVPDPNVEPMEVISIYSQNGDGTGLNQAMDAVDEMTAQALVEYGVLDEGTKAESFEVTEGLGTLDLSQVPTNGTTGEVLLLTSIGNTFVENFQLEKLKLLVNGKNYSSGHVELADDEYLEYVKDYKEIK